MRIIIALLFVLLLASCGEKHVPVDETQIATNKPYKIAGQWYYPILNADGYDEKGIASWYGKDFHGKKTSNGERYDMHAMSAAHPTLPMGTKVRVTNLENGKSMVLRINDRGPFVKSRLIDLSYAAAKEMGYADKGTTRVRVQALPADSNVEVARYTPPAQSDHAVPVMVDRPVVVERPVTVTPVRDLPAVAVATAPTGALVPAPIAAPQAVSNNTRPLASTPRWQDQPQAVATQVSAPMRGSYVQLGAFTSQENAERLRQQYLQDFPQLALFTTVGELPVTYKVRQGPFASRAQAEAMASRMEMAGVPHVSLAQDVARPAAISQAIPSPISSDSMAMNRTFVAPSSSDVAANSHALSSPPAATTSSMTQPSAGMYVQIGAFSSLQRAQQLKDRYATVYANTVVFPPKVGQAEIYRVRIGPMATAQDATALVDRVEGSGIDKAIIVVEK
jgi:rare lipoprotein A